MVTGVKPFYDDESTSVMNRIVNEGYRRPRALYPDIPWRLQRIIKRCLFKDPARRYPSTEALRRDLEDFVATRVPTHYNARLVVFFHHRNLISSREATTYVTEAELEAPEAVAADIGDLSAWNSVLRPLMIANGLGLAILTIVALILGLLPP